MFLRASQERVERKSHGCPPGFQYAVNRVSGAEHTTLRCAQMGREGQAAADGPASPACLCASPQALTGKFQPSGKCRSGFSHQQPHSVKRLEHTASGVKIFWQEI